MRILLTGASGFTGRHFARSAAAAGHSTVALEADLRQPAAIGAALGSLEFDAVVHLAAISFVAHADERAFYDVNLFGTLNLLEALQAVGRPLKKVLLASSANVYGNNARSPLAETETPEPVNHYAMSKLAMEHMARARAGQLPLVITRPFNYTGPGQAAHFVIPKIVDHFRRRAPKLLLGNVHVEREYNDVRFVCEAYLRLLAPEAPVGTYNVCSSKLWSLTDVIGKLEGMTGHRLSVETDPRLVRANELHSLCGDPEALAQVIGPLPAYSLEETLQSMLAADA